MSEFPFADQADSADESSGDTKKLLLVGGVAAAVLLGGGAFFLTTGGDAEEEAFSIPKRPAKVAPAAAAPKKAAKLPVVFAAPVGRDPFRALYTAPAAAAAGPVAMPVTGVAPITIKPVGNAPQTPSGTGGGSSAPVPRQHSLILKSVKVGDARDLLATFLIDGKGLTAKVNSIFGPSKEILLVSLQQSTPTSPWSATIRVGDGSPFTVATGEKVFVQ